MVAEPLSPAARHLVRLVVPVTFALVVAGGFLSLGGLQGTLTLTPLTGALVVMVVIRFLPPRLKQENPLADLPRAQALRGLRPILGFALVYPLLTVPVVLWIRAQPLPILPHYTSIWILTWNYVLVAKVLLLGVPAVLLAARYGGGRRHLGFIGFGHPWLWLATVASAAVDVAVNPTWRVVFQHPLPPPALDAGLVLLAFAFAGLPEELLYRILLQTRLEILIGRWPGLATSSVLFGLLHYPSRFFLVWYGATGSLALDALITLAFDFGLYVTGGLVLGYLWMRFRNAWVIIGCHTIYDAVALIAVISAAGT